MPSSGLQDPQRQLHWDELGQLMEQEQQLLRQENERLQREVQSSRTDLAHCREKVTCARRQSAEEVPACSAGPSGSALAVGGVGGEHGSSDSKGNVWRKNSP